MKTTRPINHVIDHEISVVSDRFYRPATHLGSTGNKPIDMRRSEILVNREYYIMRAISNLGLIPRQGLELFFEFRTGDN